MCKAIGRALLLGLATLVSGCAVLAPVGNPPGFPYVPEKSPSTDLGVRTGFDRPTSWSGSMSQCQPENGPGRRRPLIRPASLGFPHTVRLSRGDRINVTVPDGDEFNADYVVGPDGRIALPFGTRVRAVGLSEEQLAESIRRSLVDQRLFTNDVARVSVRLVKYAPLQISIAGAVFQPGLVTINDDPDKSQPPMVRTFGDTTFKRNLTAALREASGVRPDGDLSRVELIRRGRSYYFDLWGSITGQPALDPALEDGDRIVVHSSGCFHSQLVRPSSVTPRGIRIYVSKIHIGPDARYDEKIPFGLRLLQGAIIASCVGGNLATEGRRQIVLVSINPATGSTEVVQRSVEHLVRDQHRDEVNPLLMPDDAIACYDSTVREAVGVASAIGTIASSITAVVNTQRVLANEK